MTIKAVLFDLDGTLIDSRSVEQLRKSRNWKGCVANRGTTRVFEGVDKAIADLRNLGIQIGIVTTSVSYYAKAMCQHHKIPYDTLVCYHDAPAKPRPDSFLLALRRFKLRPDEAIGIGDDLPDSLALSAARIPAFGSGWSPVLNPDAKWQDVLASPNDVLELISRLSTRG
jgi:phosphoglycolate phosphatase-like HAD superfamily hydrolase